MKRLIILYTIAALSAACISSTSADTQKRKFSDTNDNGKPDTQISNTSTSDLLGFDVKPNYDAGTIEYTISGLDVYQTIETFAMCGAIMDFTAAINSSDDVEFRNNGFRQRALGVDASARYIALCPAYGVFGLLFSPNMLLFD